MFAYNPTVNDRSGEILGAAQANAANIQAQGMQNFGQSIGKGLAGLGGGLGDAFNKMQDNAAKANGNVGLAQALNDMYSQYGTPEQQSAFAQGLESVGNNPDKQAAYLTAHFGNINNIWKQNNMNAQYDNALNLANYKSQLQTTQALDRQNAGNVKYTN